MTAGYKFDRDGIFISFDPSAADPYKSYTGYIDSLPLNSSPQVFGIHENASIACANAEAYNIFDICRSLQRNCTSGMRENENVLEQTVENTASALYAKVQARGMYDIEAVQLLYPVVYEESMNTVLIQECIRYNKLISVILSSLPQLLKALKGSVAMTAELEATANRCTYIHFTLPLNLSLPLQFLFSLIFYFPFLYLLSVPFLENSILMNEVPVAWAAAAYPSMKPCGAWSEELLDRLQFIQGNLMQLFFSVSYDALACLPRFSSNY